jgi:hypothetical protein
MPTYILALPAPEAVRLFRAEVEAACGQPELDTSLWKEYVVEEGFAGGAYSAPDAKKSDLVTAVSTLSIEPRVERDYWILEVIIERVLGPLAECENEVVSYREMTLDEVEAEFQAPGRKHFRVRLNASTPTAKHHFDRWLAEMHVRHPEKPPLGAAALRQSTTGTAPILGLLRSAPSATRPKATARREPPQR